MSRPDLEQVVFVKNLEVVVSLDFIAAEHAERVAGFEEDDGDHHRAGEVQGVVLSERKIEGLPSLSEANPRSMAPVSVVVRPQSPRRRSRSDRTLA